MIQDRVSGVLLHITSLPSYGGVGDFGPAAYGFVDFLAAARQRVWQVLPLNPTGYGSSPYSALSAFAGNPLLISLERLVDDGWLTADRIAGLPGHEGPCDFDAAFQIKLPLILEAAGNFLNRATPGDRLRFDQFCRQNVSWLPDFALYTVLRRRFDFAGWREWPEAYALRKPEAMSAAAEEHAREAAVEQVVQFFFEEQWAALRAHCRARQVQILGDVAIFLSYDSADVWAHPEVFELDEKRNMIRVSGVPPDYFSANGQRWGNPLYKWDHLKRRGYDWWVARMRRTLALHDMVRLDHFRGFEAYWAIPADEETAMNGEWVKGPGAELFERFREVFGELPFVAEDLGHITPEVDQLRERFGMPGMRILQFGFADRGGHIYLPHKFVANTVVYTGTHDNDTTLGWWLDGASPQERAHVQTYLGPIRTGADVVWAMMRAAAASVASICIFPLQDVLGLGSEARVNTPAAGAGNWTWRFGLRALDARLAGDLAALMAMTDRDGHNPSGEPEDGTP
ncbi:MAG: 4-alpha-glucanotransferase [Acidobacteriota bacterium]|nr:4-alpha-glucanotransferase [Acidobacteriota bacterium]